MEWQEALCSGWPYVLAQSSLSAQVTVWKSFTVQTKDAVAHECAVKVVKTSVCSFLYNVFSGRRTLPRSFMPQENLFQLVPSSRTRSYNGDSTLQYSDLRSMGRTADKSSQRGSAKCKTGLKSLKTFWTNVWTGYFEKYITFEHLNFWFWLMH